MRLTAAAVLLLLATVSPTLAQVTRRPPARPAPSRSGARQQLPRFYAGVDFGVQASSRSFIDTVTFPSNGETATLSTPYETKAGPLLGLFVDARVWKYVSAGVSITGYASKSDTQVTGALPHPFFFNRPRALSGDVSGLERSESGVHVHLRAQLPVSKKVQVSVFGGPSFFHVNQDLVTEVRYADDYPHDAVSFTTATTETRSTSVTGFNVGVDVGHFLGRHFGVGGRVQYASATVDLPAANSNATIDTKIGGLQAGGGVRFRF